MIRMTYFTIASSVEWCLLAPFRQFHERAGGVSDITGSRLQLAFGQP
jgi:hypothetical protein